jgi:histidinol phosphatase-like PHP family hydrolase
MAEVARELGHEYVVLSDHSPRLTVANGLSAERLVAQLDEVARLNRRLADEAAAGGAPAFRVPKTFAHYLTSDLIASGIPWSW